MRAPGGRVRGGIGARGTARSGAARSGERHGEFGIAVHRKGGRGRTEGGQRERLEGHDRTEGGEGRERTGKKPIRPAWPFESRDASAAAAADPGETRLFAWPDSRQKRRLQRQRQRRGYGTECSHEPRCRSRRGVCFSVCHLACVVVSRRVVCCLVCCLRSVGAARLGSVCLCDLVGARPSHLLTRPHVNQRLDDLATPNTHKHTHCSSVQRARTTLKHTRTTPTFHPTR